MYEVRWKKSAVNDLARFWVDEDSLMRKAISRAANRIEKQLAYDPENTGESREGNERVYHEFPLGVLFAVDQASQMVRVLQVWKYTKRK